MRSCITWLFLVLSGYGALAESESAVGSCGGAYGCIPPREGICEHPKVVIDGGIPKYDGTPSSAYEKQCILRTKSFARRRGNELRLTFRNGTTRAYKDNQSPKACEQGSYESCKQYVLYDFFPEHELFLINIEYYESPEWRLVRQLKGNEETIVAPPRYSSSKKWLASVDWNEFDDRNNGIDIVPAMFNTVDRSFHYRPKEYELWQFVAWDGDDRLV